MLLLVDGVAVVLIGVLIGVIIKRYWFTLTRKNATGVITAGTKQYPYEAGRIDSSLFVYGLQVWLPVYLPNIIVDSHHNDARGTSLVFDAFRSQRMTLEGDFYKDCAVYVPKGFEQIALQLLTPDVMQLLQAGSRDFDMEVMGPRLNIMARRDPRDDAELLDVEVQLAAAMLRKWGGFIGRWDETQYPDHAAMMLRGHAEGMPKLGRHQLPRL